MVASYWADKKVLPLGFSPQSFGDTAGGGNTKLSTCALLFGVTFFGVTTLTTLLVLPLADNSLSDTL